MLPATNLCSFYLATIEMESEISDVPEELELDERSIVCLDCELLVVLPDEKAKRDHDEIEHPWKCAAVVPEPIEAVVPEPIVAVVPRSKTRCSSNYTLKQGIKTQFLPVNFSGLSFFGLESVNSGHILQQC